MTKAPSKTNNAPSASAVKPRRTKTPFKPDIRLANAIVGAIAFLQKAGLHATPKVIKKCIKERAKKSFSKSIEQMPRYLNQGVELGILKKNHGGFKLGNFQIRKKNIKRRRVGKATSSKSVKVIKSATSGNDQPENHDMSEKSSMCVF